jgi:uncharacterized protein
LNGSPFGVDVGADGYLRARRTWERGDEVSIELSLRPRVTRPSPRIDSLRGCFALERGPFVYCFEPATVAAAGRPLGLDGLLGRPERGLSERRARVGPENVVEVVVPARKVTMDIPAGWPYFEARPTGADDAQEVDFPAVPYYTWCNRGPSEMRVWLPEQGAKDDQGSTGPQSRT